MYYEACSVLKTEKDFYDLMYAYLRKASVDNVFVAEIFFDPQTHTEREIPFNDVINGLYKATLDGFANFGIRASLIMCFLRDKSEEDALKTLEEAKPHVDKIIGIGLDSAEVGNPPSKFKRVYKLASDMGLKLVAHAGEEAGADYILEALDILKVQRIDHGVQCLKDSALVSRLAKDKVPLTTCPLSNLKLQVLSRYFKGQDITKELLSKNLMVTVNSDDPAYFGGYITDNFLHIASVGGITEKEVYQICKNAFQATFLSNFDKLYYLKRIEKFNVEIGCTAPPKSITFFGSRRPRDGSEEYKDCEAAARLMSSNGYSIIHGGYSGLMEASSKGCYIGGNLVDKENLEGSSSVSSVGILAPRVFSGRHAAGNSYVTKPKMARSIVERIDRLTEESQYFFVSGGTIGTITELFVAWNIASIRPMSGCIPPKIFVLRSFWEKTLKEMMATVGIYKEDCALITFVENKEELFKLVDEDWKKRCDNVIM